MAEGTDQAEEITPEVQEVIRIDPLNQAIFCPQGEEGTPGYKTPKMVDLKTIQDLDADDESLVKYKQTLLGQTAGVLGKEAILVSIACGL